MRKVLFFIHIPKTAGTSIVNMLSRNLPGKLIHLPHHFLEGPVSEHNLKAWLEKDTRTMCVASHRLSLDLPWDNEHFEVRAFAVVREPIDWLLSQFFYCAKPGIISMVNLDEDVDIFIESFLRGDKAPTWADFQYKFLTKNYHGADIRSLVNAGKLILLPQDRLIEGCLRLQLLYPDVLPDTNLARLNVSSRRSKKHNMSPEIINQLQKKFPEDINLYKIANQGLDEWIDNYDPIIWRDSLDSFKKKSIQRTRFREPVKHYFGRLNSLIQRW